MEILDNLAKASLRQGTILTIGVFDGVHLGHQALIRQVVARARASDCLAAVLTFHPHPAALLAPDRAPRALTTLGERLALLSSLQVDVVAIVTFDQQTASTPAHEFMEQLSTHLRLRELWIGPDFALGRGREGDVSRLRELGLELGYRVEAVQPQVTLGDGAVISSSRIRSLLQEGRVDQAALMLGRYPSLSGEVVAGARRGRKLGFPTANLEVRPERAVPANGVYAAFALLGSRRLPAVANVGVRPSFDNGQRTVETHILDFDQDIYGCDLVVEFVARLRDEVRFESMAGLIAQIERDSQQARQILCTGRAGAGVTEAELGSRESGIDGFVDWESGVGSRGGVTPPARAGLPRPYRYREVEHTADRAIRVWGRELPNLFVGAAQGMVHLMADLEGVAGTHWRTIALEAIDLESLLVNWLNELLFLTEIEGILFVEHRVEELTGTRLVARAGGVPGEVTKARVKAATFHDLRLARDETGWSTTITFDV